MLTEWLVTVVQFYLVRDFFNLREILLQSKNYLISGIIMLAVTWLLSIQLSSSIINTLLIILVGSVVYAGILLVIKDQILLMLINKIKENV